MLIQDKQISNWLFICCFFIFLMVIIGGLTRLTGSGLSMVDWRPITGWLPPLSDIIWQVEFAKYQNSPEFNKINYDFGLAEFKKIFYWEYIHRVMGRITGLVLFVPFFYFLFKGRFGSKLYALRIFGIISFVGVQGAIGWIMVSSGLQDLPYVNHYKLALHLGSAFLLYIFIFYNGLKTKFGSKEFLYSSFNCLLIATIFIQTILGAFVAGLDAGMIYNTYPTMNGEWVPHDLKFNFGDHTFVQFIHRIFAYVVMAIIILNAFKRNFDNYSLALLVGIFIQFALGITTLIYGVPIVPASLHQITALGILTLAMLQVKITSS